MALHSRTTQRRRAPKPAQTAPTTDTSEDAPMQKQQQPVAPAVVIKTDKALRLIWGPHEEVMQEARTSAQTADSLERRAAERRDTAQANRREAARLESEAAELEAAANKDLLDAQFHRQEQSHSEQAARDIEAAVQFLHSTNGKLHPEELRQRMEQQAVANAAAPDPLSAPLGDLVSASADPAPTAQFPAPAAVEPK